MFRCRIDQNDAVDRVKVNSVLTCLPCSFSMLSPCLCCVWGTRGPTGSNKRKVPHKWSWALSYERIPSRHSSPFLWLRSGHKHSHLFSSRQSVEIVATLQVRSTPAAAFYQSQRQLLPGAPHYDGIQFSNLIARDNLKVFPQVGSRSQNVLRWLLRPVLWTLSSHAVRA